MKKSLLCVIAIALISCFVSCEEKETLTEYKQTYRIFTNGALTSNTSSDFPEIGVLENFVLEGIKTIENKYGKEWEISVKAETETEAYKEMDKIALAEYESHIQSIKAELELLSTNYEIEKNNTDLSEVKESYYFSYRYVTTFLQIKKTIEAFSGYEYIILESTEYNGILFEARGELSED